MALVAHFAIATICFMIATAYADKIVMKNGNTFQGQILEEDDKQIVLKMEYGTMTFKKAEIKKVSKERYVRPKPPSTDKPEVKEPPPVDPGKDAIVPVRKYLFEADKAAKARNFMGALAALKKARDVAKSDAPATVSLIDAKIRKIKEQALIAIEIKIDKVFVPEAMRDPAVRHNRNAPPVSDAPARKEAEGALWGALRRALHQRGFIVIEPQEAEGKRVQKLVATYSDTGGIAYRGRNGEITGYRIFAKCGLALVSPRGGRSWSKALEAATPNIIGQGTTREGAIRALEGQMAGLSFGIR